MISTDALQVGFLSPSLFVNNRKRRVVVSEGLSLTIVNEITNFIKTVVFENDHFLKRFPLKTIFYKNDCFVFRFFVVVFITKQLFFLKIENDPSLRRGVHFRKLINKIFAVKQDRNERKILETKVHSFLEAGLQPWTGTWVHFFLGTSIQASSGTSWQTSLCLL